MNETHAHKSIEGRAYGKDLNALASPPLYPFLYSIFCLDIFIAALLDVVEKEHYNAYVLFPLSARGKNKYTSICFCMTSIIK